MLPCAYLLNCQTTLRCTAPYPAPRPAGMTKLAPGSDAAAQAAQMVAAGIPLGHMGRRWDIAMACLYLARWDGGLVYRGVLLAGWFGAAEVGGGACPAGKRSMPHLCWLLAAHRPCSPAAAFVTGHTLVVDGGEWMCRCVAGEHCTWAERSRGLQLRCLGMPGPCLAARHPPSVASTCPAAQ